MPVPWRLIHRPFVLPRSNPAREAFVDLCEDTYVQKMTFDSYLYKTVVPGNPIDDVKLLVRTVSCLLRANALRQGEGLNVTFGSKPNEEHDLTITLTWWACA